MAASVMVDEALHFNLIQEIEYQISESEQTSFEIFMPSSIETWALIPQNVI
jgi:hypothetical protein